MSELPDTWAQVPISEVAEVNPRKSVDLNGDDPVSFVPMAAVDEVSGTIATSIDRPYSEVSKGFTHFRDEDVIFAKITPSMENGKSAVARDLTNGTGMGSTEFHVFRSYGAIEPEYLWRYVRQQSFRDDAQAVMSGAVGQQRVPADWLKEHMIPLAPKAEQRRIVEKVNSPRTRKTNTKKDRAMVAKPMSTRTQLLDDCKEWPASGLTYEDVAKRVARPYDDMREALFELLSEAKPQIVQAFDPDREIIVLRRAAV